MTDHADALAALAAGPPRPASNARSRGAVVIASGDHDWRASAEGIGAIDALYRAVDEALVGVLNGHPRLLAYDIHALGEGTDTIGAVTVRIAPPDVAGERGQGEYTGEARGPNIIAASIEAYIAAINLLLARGALGGRDRGGRQPAWGRGVGGHGARAAGRHRRGEGPAGHDGLVRAVGRPRVQALAGPVSGPADSVMSARSLGRQAQTVAYGAHPSFGGHRAHGRLQHSPRRCRRLLAGSLRRVVVGLGNARSDRRFLPRARHVFEVARQATGAGGHLERRRVPGGRRRREDGAGRGQAGGRPLGRRSAQRPADGTGPAGFRGRRTAVRDDSGTGRDCAPGAPPDGHRAGSLDLQRDLQHHPTPSSASSPDSVPVAYAGEPGAFAEDAVLAAFGDVERASLGSFREVFDAVARGEASAGVVPIENVINGTVRENYDLLLEFDLVIRGEVVVPVSLCLAALPGQRIDDIERVYSHIQALGQAEAFLRPRPWQLLTTYNTAGAGKAIADRARARRRRRPVAPGGRPVRPGGPRRRDRRPRRQPDAVPRPRARRTDRALPLVDDAAASSDDARRRRPQRARHAPGRPACLRRPRPQHAQARVASRAASARGSTSSGSTSTATPRTRRWRRPSTSSTA